MLIKDSLKQMDRSKRMEKQLFIPELIDDLESENAKVKKLHLTELGGHVYKVFGIVTNLLDWEGGAVIRWYRERCGKSEEVHRLYHFSFLSNKIYR